jgi:hypothetical protein
MKKYIGSCVDWPRSDVHTAGGLCDMIDSAVDITRRTFRKHIDPDELADIETSMGYAHHHSQGLTMSADWHVSYHRSNLHGKRVYYFRWSAIEYVFA